MQTPNNLPRADMGHMVHSSEDMSSMRPSATGGVPDTFRWRLRGPLMLQTRYNLHTIEMDHMGNHSEDISSMSGSASAGAAESFRCTRMNIQTSWRLFIPLMMQRQYSLPRIQMGHVVHSADDNRITTADSFSRWPLFRPLRMWYNLRMIEMAHVVHRSENIGITRASAYGAVPDIFRWRLRGSFMIQTGNNLPMIEMGQVRHIMTASTPGPVADNIRWCGICLLMVDKTYNLQMIAMYLMVQSSDYISILGTSPPGGVAEGFRRWRVFGLVIMHRQEHLDMTEMGHVFPSSETIFIIIFCASGGGPNGCRSCRFWPLMPQEMYHLQMVERCHMVQRSENISLPSTSAPGVVSENFRSGNYVEENICSESITTHFVKNHDGPWRESREQALQPEWETPGMGPSGVPSFPMSLRMSLTWPGLSTLARPAPQHHKVKKPRMKQSRAQTHLPSLWCPRDTDFPQVPEVVCSLSSNSVEIESISLELLSSSNTDSLSTVAQDNENISDSVDILAKASRKENRSSSPRPRRFRRWWNVVRRIGKYIRDKCCCVPPRSRSPTAYGEVITMFAEDCRAPELDSHMESSGLPSRENHQPRSLARNAGQCVLPSVTQKHPASATHLRR